MNIKGLCISLVMGLILTTQIGFTAPTYNVQAADKYEISQGDIRADRSIQIKNKKYTSLIVPKGLNLKKISLNNSRIKKIILEKGDYKLFLDKISAGYKPVIYIKDNESSLTIPKELSKLLKKNHLKLNIKTAEGDNNFSLIGDDSVVKIINNTSTKEKSKNTSDNDAKDLAPNISLTDQYGKNWDLSSLKGKIVLLNFWATWCPPCREELPDLQAVYKKFGSNKKDLVLLGVTEPTGSVDKVKDFLNKRNVTYPTLMDIDGSATSTYTIFAYPTTFVIDREGKLLGAVQGAINKDNFEKAVAKLIKDTK